jgi:hypothetical protein
LVWVIDDQDRPPNPAQQTPNCGGGELVGECTAWMTPGHDQIDVVCLRTRRDGAGSIPNANINMARWAGTPEPAANLDLE